MSSHARTVSVIVAAYGQEEYLAETIEALHAQTFTDWEAIIVDDGSPDGVACIADTFARKDDRIRVLRTANGGVSVARNRAAAVATGKYLLALDGDDLIAPDYLTTCVKAMEENPLLKAAFTQMKCFGVRTDSWPVFYDSYSRLLLNNPLYLSGMVRRADFEASGGFDEAMTAGFEDWEFWIRFLKGVDPRRVFVADGVKFFYRQKSVSRNTGVLGNRAKLLSCYRHILERHHQEYDRILHEPVQPEMLADIDYWMIEPIEMAQKSLDARKEVTAEVVRKFKHALKYLARRREIPVKRREELIALLMKIYRKVIKTGKNASEAPSLRLLIAGVSPRLYVRWMNLCLLPWRRAKG